MDAAAGPAGVAAPEGSSPPLQAERAAALRSIWPHELRPHSLAALFLLPGAHPLLLPLVGVPSHLLWFVHVLPVALLTYARGRDGLPAAVTASLALVLSGERLFGAGYGTSADWHTALSLALAVGFTNLLVGGFALYARRVDSEYRHLALHDELTGLPNRALLIDRMAHALARSRRNPEELHAALFLDLDRFKRLNDALGHGTGDLVLLGVAERLARCTREGDTLARLGGDEFVVFVEGVSGAAAAVRAADRIVAELEEPLLVQDRQFRVTASIGIAVARTGHGAPGDILRDADTAMYVAKARGGAAVEFFNAAHHRQALESLQLEGDLRRAIQESGIQLRYQPVVDLATGRVLALEALVRWHHPDLGPLPPSRFIPLAEETGLIVPLGERVLREACGAMRKWLDGAAGGELRVNVNFSPRQLAHPNIVEQVSKALVQSGLPGSRLTVEITETALMDEQSGVEARLHALRALGVEIAIDDFGTGYSSLAYLERFPIDALKIDRSFVSRLAGGGGKPEIVRAVVRVARSLRLKLVAEGIETSAQRSVLQRLRCPAGQGYLISPPRSERGICALLRSGRLRTA